MQKDAEIVDLIKKAYEYKLPKWKQDYMASICKNLQVHTKGLLFSKVDTLFPNEHPDSKAHCVNTYEPITKGSIGKATNNVLRIFSNSSFTVSASDSTLEFVNQDKFEGENLFSHFVKKWISTTIEADPNSLCAIYPESYLEDHPGCAVKFISSEFVRHIGRDMVVFVSEEESEKEYSLEDSVFRKETFYDPKLQGPNSKLVVEKTYNQRPVCKIIKQVTHVFTKEFLLSFKSDDGKYFSYEYYPFVKPFENIPAFKVTASSLMLDVNESFVAPFIPFGNLALLSHRNHRAVDLTFSYPRMSEVETPCEAQGCEEGYVRGEDDKQSACARCGGSGFVTAQSPYKTYKKKIDTGITDPEVLKLLLGANPVDFHTPDTGILDYSKDSWQEYLAKAEEAVFVQQKQKTGNVESSKSKELDKEAEYSFIQNISKALNTDLKKAVQAFEDYLNASPSPVSIEQPIALALVTESEAFQALETIISSDSPIFVKSQQVENFIHKYVSKSSPVVKALKILKLIDPLLFYSNKDLQTFKSNNIVSVEAWTIHVYAYMVLMQLYEADKTLFTKEENVIIEMVKAGIEQLKPLATDLKTRIEDV